jgi:hypothetical protein
MARYGKSSFRKRFKKGRVVKSQKRFVNRICEMTGRTFWELANLARLPYKPTDIRYLRFDEADMLVQYCYTNIDYLKKESTMDKGV